MRESTHLDGSMVREFYPADQFLRLEEDVKRDLRNPQIKQVRSVRIGRNDDCPCGSGRKFKKCCIQKLPDDLINRNVVGGGK